MLYEIQKLNEEKEELLREIKIKCTTCGKQCSSLRCDKVLPIIVSSITVRMKLKARLNNTPK